MRPPRQPYALDMPSFPFAATASFAAKAPLGGAREIGLAAYLTARMADDTVSPRQLRAEERRARAAGARRWLATLTIAEPVRRAFLDLVTATEGDPPQAAGAVRRVMDVTGAVLDEASRGELERLARELEAQPIART